MTLHRTLAPAVRTMIAAAGLLTVSGGCAPPRPRPYQGPTVEADPRPFAGCWRLAYRAARGAPTGTWRFALDTVAPSGDRARFAEAGSRAARVSFQESDDVGYWRMIGRDSLQLRVTDGLHGFGYDLAAEGDSLVGLAFQMSDFTPPDAPIRRVSARRVTCSG